MSPLTRVLQQTAFLTMAVVLALIALAAFRFGPVSAAFMPHRHCLDAAGHPWLLWITVASNLAIAGAYYVIPVGLIAAAVRGYAPAPGLFYLFAAFIMACGTTHLFAVWVMWEPIYFAEAAVLAVTALISWITVREFLIEGRQARHAMPIVGRKLREAALELRDGDVAGASNAIADALELVAAHLERLQPPEPAA